MSEVHFVGKTRYDMYRDWLFNLLSDLTGMKRRFCPGKGVGALKDHD